jgi:diguanylate cyclase
MPLDYDLDTRLKALSPVREEHTQWYSAIMRKAFYPETLAADHAIKKPESFLYWLKETGDSGLIDNTTLARMKKLHDDLHAAADQFLAAASSGKKPASEKFDKLTMLFEEFLIHLGRLEVDCLMENSGLDPVTGLRSRNVMYKDLERELERLSRQGKAFTIAITRIDDYDQILASQGEGRAKGYVKLVSDLIKSSLRSFDDAYVSSPDEFVLSLKQSDIPGGIKALERLRTLLEERNVLIKMGDGKIAPLTLSCCIAEPLPGDRVEDLLDGLRRDLQETTKASGQVLQYYEMSPLQRYVQGVRD